MKYLTFSFFVMMLALSIEINAQGKSSCEDNEKSCELYKIGILTLSKHIDFKMVIIVPPKDIDQAMVVNPCAEQNRAAFIPSIIVPRRQRKEYLKVPQLQLRNRHSQQ